MLDIDRGKKSIAIALNNYRSRIRSSNDQLPPKTPATSTNFDWEQYQAKQRAEVKSRDLSARPARSKEVMLNDVITQWAEATTVHGVADWLNASNVTCKLVWAAILVSGLFISSLQTYQIVGDYLAQPHYVTRVQFSSASNKPKYPFVTICNFNAVNRTKAIELGIPKNVVSALLLSLHRMTMSDIYTLMSNEQSRKLVEQIVLDWDEFYGQNPSNTEVYHLLRELGHSCEETLKDCLVAGSYVWNCCDTAKAVILTDYGLCWSMRVPEYGKLNKTKYSVGAGRRLGLRMVVGTGDEDCLYHSIIAGNSLEAGIAIGLNTDQLRPEISSGLFVSPAHRLDVPMTMQSHKVITPKWPVIFKPPCRPPGAYLKVQQGNYKVDACMFECQVQQRFWSELGCTFASERLEPYSLRTCNVTDIYKHAKNIIDNQISVNGTSGLTGIHTPGPDLEEQCHSYCQPECGKEYSVYGKSTVELSWPSAEKLEHMKALGDSFGDDGPQLFLEAMEPSTVLLNIYFLSQDIELIEYREKIPIENLLSSIGGLWMGASMMSFVQFFSFFGCSRRCRK